MGVSSQRVIEDTACEAPALPWTGPDSALEVSAWEPVPPDFTPLGLFGTGIQSYFTFLRFLLLLNLLTLLMTASFVLLPLVWLRHPEPGPALKLSELELP